MKNKQIKGILLLILTTILWGCSFVAQRSTVEDIDPFTFNVGRNVSAFLCLLVVVIVRQLIRQKKDPTPEGRAIIMDSDRKALVIGGILCGLFLFGGLATQQMGLMTTGAGKTGFITALYIVEVPILAIAFGQKTGRKLWFCVALALIGLWLLTIEPGASLSLNRGEVILLIGSVFFAIQIILIDHFVQKAEPLLLTLVEFFVCAVLFPVFAFILEDPSWEVFAAAAIPILYAGVLSSAVGFTLQSVAQKDVNPTLASLIMSLEAVFAVLGAWVLIGEYMSARELAGCAIMFAAIIITQLPERNKSKGEV